jgi:redox-sensitive bicupin YhaK (pirin superfamily)
MKTNAVFTRPIRAEAAPRQIVVRTRGHAHGAVTRLVSPGDVGELIKPFVFLDYFNADPATAPKFGFHPHSGIATLTLILSGQAFYKETTGREGVIDTGGVEWMRAGSGVWHAGGMYGAERIKGFQLWVAMPPELELTEAKSQYLAASDFQRAAQRGSSRANTTACKALSSLRPASPTSMCTSRPASAGPFDRPKGTASLGSPRTKGS